MFDHSWAVNFVIVMKKVKARKQWKKPQVKAVQLCCECTAYVGAE
jgi:hypothetical protein